MNETEVRKSIKDALTARGWFVLQFEEAVGWGKAGTKGVPDLLAIKDGRYLWTEVKTPNKRSQVSPSQMALHAQMIAAGADVIVARSIHEVFAHIGEPVV